MTNKVFRTESHSVIIKLNAALLGSLHYVLLKMFSDTYTSYISSTILTMDGFAFSGLNFRMQYQLQALFQELDTQNLKMTLINISTPCVNYILNKKKI